MPVLQEVHRQLPHGGAATGHLLDAVLPDSLVSVERPRRVGITGRTEDNDVDAESLPEAHKCCFLRANVSRLCKCSSPVLRLGGCDLL